MTEDEAAKKYCPFSGNAEGRWSKCMGRTCMAWLHAEPVVERRETGLGCMPAEPYERYQREGWRQVERPYPGADGLFYERTIREGGGYCARIGRPE